MKAARGIALLAFSELVVWPTAALAQDSKLSEVTVYGERPAAFRNITTSTEAATAEIIDGTNVINTEDAVKYLPSIQIRKRYIGDRNAIVASRNAGTLDSARSLVYADNVLVSNLLGNSYAFAPRWWFVMPQEIERVDVSYGAHSAAYAGNAVGVVMVMKSRLPDRFEAAADAQVRANEYLVQAGELELVSNPVQFDVAAPQSGPAPGFAEQTDEILEEIGLDWDRIIELKTAGAVT